VSVYETLVIGVLLYNSETWTLATAHENRLRAFEMVCLHKIEGVTRKDRTINEAEIRIRSRLQVRQDIINRIQPRRQRCFGNV